jgi:hypothetical protein
MLLLFCGPIELDLTFQHVAMFKVSVTTFGHLMLPGFTNSA